MALRQLITNNSVLNKFTESDNELYWNGNKVLLDSGTGSGVPDPSNVIAYFDSSNNAKKVLDTSAGITTVYSLEDTINSYIVSQPSKSNQPIQASNVQNGKDSILYDNQRMLRNISGILSSANFPSNIGSIIVAFSMSSTTVSAGYYSICNTDNNLDAWWRWNGNGHGYMAAFRNSRLDTYPLNMPLVAANYIMSVRSSSTEYEVRINGVSKGVSTPSWGYGTDFRINDIGKGLYGHIFGVIVRKDDIVAASEQYLNTYWALNLL